MPAPLRSLTTLTLEEATTIASVALGHGHEASMSPLSVVVIDAAGSIKCVQTDDGASLMRSDIANAKAWGCLGMGFSSRAATKFAEQRPDAFSTFRAISGNRLVPSPGGVMIGRDGVVIGAVGVSGDTGENDELCALAGVEAAGLQTQV